MTTQNSEMNKYNGKLSGYRILIISPQPWDHIAVSKHHYAEVLGRNNDVHFLQPPSNSIRRGSFRRVASGKRGVTVVEWMTNTPARLKHAWPRAYAAAIAIDVRHLLKRMDWRPDIAWSFDCGRYPDLRAFGAPLTILHPVDPLASERDAEIGHTADIIFSVSEDIISSFCNVKKEKHVIGHGIGLEFQRLANISAGNSRSEILQCGYFGNLDLSFINADLIREVASDHPEVTFNFWGPSSSGSRLRTALDGVENCKFHGALAKEQLVNAAAKMDCFIIAYDGSGYWDRSNSHKILEYFAAGSVVISTRMDAFADTDLVVMSRESGDADFPELFTSAVANISLHNAPARIDARKAIALKNSYESQVDRIAQILGRLTATGTL